jgi:hypothetical protein
MNRRVPLALLAGAGLEAAIVAGIFRGLWAAW